MPTITNFNGIFYQAVEIGAIIPFQVQSLSISILLMFVDFCFDFDDGTSLFIKLHHAIELDFRQHSFVIVPARAGHAEFKHCAYLPKLAVSACLGLCFALLLNCCKNVYSINRGSPLLIFSQGQRSGVIGDQKMALC